ncbi:MAG: hypothetical protein V3W41_17940 [Planctomycetota bacterium]
MNMSMQVFNEQYVESTSSSDLGTITSSPVAARGNKVVMAATVINLAAAGSETLSLQMQGSYDGKAWENTGTAIKASSFGYYDSSQANLDFAWIRIRAEGASIGTSLKAVFDAFLAFSEQ